LFKLVADNGTRIADLGYQNRPLYQRAQQPLLIKRKAKVITIQGCWVLNGRSLKIKENVLKGDQYCKFLL